MDWKKKARNTAMQKKQDEKTQIKKEFVDSGDADRLISIIREKAKREFEVSDLPF